MNKPVKPMLATNAPADLQSLTYPLLASPKLDGIRAIVKDGVVFSRSGKPIPNEHVQYLFSHLHGLDGELIVGHPTAEDVFRVSTSGVMSREGKPEVFFYVFDRWDVPNMPYGIRMGMLLGVSAMNVIVVEQQLVTDAAAVESYEAFCLSSGFEGAMLRTPKAVYKHGRSTAREAALLKVKRFLDGEAEVIGFEERQHNDNEAKRNALGIIERSTRLDGMVGMDTLGALVVRDNSTGIEFNIGTGFTDAERAAIWTAREQWLGSLVKYKYFPTGSKDKPRFPVFDGQRSPLDL